MQVLVLTVKLYAPWVQSLKEKRMVVKSLTARMKNRFNASVREADEQDTHKTAIIELAALCTSNAEADGLEEQMIGFIEQSTDAEITLTKREMR